MIWLGINCIVCRKKIKNKKHNQVKCLFIKCRRIRDNELKIIRRKENSQLFREADKRWYKNNKKKKNKKRKIYYKKNRKIISIRKIKKRIPVYDILGVEGNNNFVANDIVVHNCDESIRFASSEDWNKSGNKILKKKLAQVRTKHLFYILCFPLKIYKLEKNYLESFTNYWIDLFGRGTGSIYVKDRNPRMDSWRLKAFDLVGSYTEFTNLSKVEMQLKKHPNFWSIIKFPKPPAWLYNRYLKVREANIYDDENVFANVSKEDIHNALLVLALRDIMIHDTTLSMNRIILHIKNEYDISISKGMIQNAIEDAKQLVIKIREQAIES